MSHESQGLNERNEWGKGVEHTLHVEIVVIAHRVNVECAPHFPGVLLVLVADARVGQLREKRILGWELLFIHFLPAIHILIRVEPLPHE